MTEALPVPTPETTPKITIENNDKMKPSDFLSLITVALTISAAVFYIAGWVYEVYWYGFFGINITQINIPLQQIMIEGLPGILIIAFGLLVAFLFFAGRRNRQDDIAENLDVLRIILTAYSVSVFIILFIGIMNGRFLIPLPFEIIVSGIGLVVVFIILVLLPLSQRNRIARLLEATTELSPLLMQVALTSILAGPSIGMVTQKLLQEVIESSKFKSILKEYSDQGASIAIAVINAWRVWVGLVILFFLFLSLTTSAILGRANAHYGKRLMMGGWEMSETYVYSSKSDLPLPTANEKANNGFTYGPFALIASDDQIYYLADWKNGRYYVSRPNVYTLPRSNDTSLIILYVPQPTPTPLPIPTVTMTPSSTATSLPSSATPTP